MRWREAGLNVIVTAIYINRASALCKTDCECDCRNVTCTFERRAEKINDNGRLYCLSLFLQNGEIPSHLKTNVIASIKSAPRSLSVKRHHCKKTTTLPCFQ